MAVISVCQIRDGWTSELTFENLQLSVTWEVEVDSDNDGPLDLIDEVPLYDVSVPKVGDVYDLESTGNTAVCNRVRVAPDTRKDNLWNYIASFGDGDSSQTGVDPVLWPYKYWVEYEQSSQEFKQDGNGLRIASSAGEPLPQNRLWVTPVYIVREWFDNFAAIVNKSNATVNKTNSTAFLGSAKWTLVSASPNVIEERARDTQTYWQVDWRFRYEEDVSFQVLDEGTRKLLNGVDQALIIDDGLFGVQTRARLDGNGVPLKDPLANDVMLGPYLRYPEIDFNTYWPNV